jgi:hypothetical protein
MAAPTFVSWAAATWSSNTSPKTLNVSVTAGDIMVVNAASEGPPTILGVSGGGLVYTLQQSYVGTASTPNAYLWTATASTTTTVTVSIANTGSTQQWGFEVYVFRNAAVGASNKSQATGTTASASLTTTAANSAIVLMMADWNAVAIAGRTWATINSITPTSGNTLEKVATATGNYTIFSAYWNDAGAAGAKTPGITAASMKPSLVTIEIKGTSSTTTVNLGTASETDTANPLTRRKSRTTGFASEVDAAQPITRRKSRTLSVAAEVDTANPVARRKSRTLGTAAEVDSAFPLVIPDPEAEPTFDFYRFSPPTMQVYMSPRDRLWKHFAINRGITIMVRGSDVYEEMWPQDDDFALFDHVYVGGHEYTIPAAEAATLIAAGYSANLTGV